MEGTKKFNKKRIVLAAIAGVILIAGALGVALKAYQTETANAKRAAAQFVRQVSNDSTKEIEITGNISLSEPLVIDTEKVITGSGLIKASSEWKTQNGDNNYLFVIKEGGSLTVKGSVKMDAKKHVGAIYVDKETNLSLEEQAEISGGKENAIYDAGTFTQKGGIVKGSFNNVYVAEGGKFTFSEGENKSAGNCGIFVAEEAYLNTTTLKASVQKARTDGIRVEGEAVIDHIRMLENRRNQIHVTKTGELTLNKGNFEKAKLHGITNSGTMVMNNGVITESGSSGIVNMGTLDIKGGRIYANEEKGVINRRGGTLTILSENATITGNNIGVAVEENSKAEIAKANLNSNDLYNISCFGGLYLHDIATGDSGSNCIATNYGGHIVAENIVITSTRTNNGIYNINGSLIELKDVTIKDTKAKGIQNKGATLIGENVTITGCGQGVGTGEFAFGIKNKVELNNLVIKETKGINVLMDKETKGTLKITNAELGFSESNNIRTYSGKLILENVKINGTKGTGTPGTKEYKANTHCILSDETEIVAKNIRMTNNGGSALRLRAGTKFTGTNITANNIKGNGLSAVEADVNIQKFTVAKTGESAIYLEKSGNITLTNVKITEAAKNNVNIAKKFTGTATLKNAALGKTTTNNIRTHDGKLVLEDVKIYGTTGTVDKNTEKVTLNNHCILADNTTVVAKGLWMTSEGGSGLRLRQATKFTGTDVVAENVAYNGISGQDASVDIKGFTVTKTGQSAIALEKGGKVTLTDVKVTEAGINNVNLAEGFTGTATLKNAELGKTTTNNIRTFGGKLVLEDVNVYGASGTVNKDTGKVTFNNHGVLADNTEVQVKNLYVTNEGGSGLRLRTGSKLTGTDVVVEDVAYNGLSSQDASAKIKGFTVTNTGESAIALEKGGNVTLTDVKITEAGINNVNLAEGFTGTATLKNAELGKTTTNNIRTYDGKLVLEDVEVYGVSGASDHCICTDNTTVEAKNIWMTNEEGASGLRLREGTIFTGTDITIENVKSNGISSTDASADIKGLTVTKTGESAIYFEKSGNITLTDVKVTEAGKNNVNIAEGFTGTATLKNAELGITTTNNIRTYGGKLVLEDVKVCGVSGASDHCICTDNTTVEAKNIWMTNEEGASGLRLRKDTTFTGTDITIENVKGNGISSTDASADIKGLTVTKTGESAIYFEKSGNITLTDVKVTEAGKNNVNIAEGFTGTATLKNAELGITTTNNIRTYGGKLVLEDVKVHGATGTSNHCILTDNTTVEADNVWMTNKEGASGLRLRKGTTFNGTDITIENVKGNGISTGTDTVDTTITGLTIQGAQGDAIVYDTKGTHILENVTIATADEKCGVSVNSKNAVVSMTDATITGGSKAINNKGNLTLVSGLYQNDIEQNGTLTMGTDAVVGYNANWEMTAGKVILVNGTPVQFSGETKHTDAKPMTFSMKAPSDKAIVATFTSSETAIALQNRFKMDDDNLSLEADDKNLILDITGNVAKVDGKYYKDLQEAIDKAADSTTQPGVVELISEYPIVVSSTIAIPENAKVTIKDNGTEQTFIRATGADGTKRFVLFDILEGTTLSIESTGSITIDGNNGATTPENANWAMFDVAKDGTFNMSGNIKVMNNTSTKAGSVIRTETGAKEININGAVFEKNVSGNEGIIYMADSATKIVVQDTEFVKNSAKYGGAIYTSSTDVTIDRCKFIKNSASENGGAIQFNGSVIGTITNTSFEGNKAKKAGAITVGTGGKVSLANCEFTDNKNTGTGNNYEGDDVRLGGATCEIKISGKFVGNVHSRNSSKVQIVGALSAGSAVEVDWYDRRTHSTPVPNYFPLEAILFVDAEGNANTNADEVKANKNYIQLGGYTFNQGLELAYEGTKGTVVVDTNVAIVNGTPYKTLPEAVNAANTITSEGTTIVTLLKNTEVESTMTISSNVTIQNKAGRSITVYRGIGLAKAAMFDVTSTGSLTIQGVETANSLIFDGRTKAEANANKGIDAAAGSSASMINNNGTVNLKDVTVQYVKKVDGNGSVIYNQGTSFNASGCTFSYNRGKEGGVIWSNQHYTVDGCTFTDNSSTTYGGVILNRSTANIKNSTFQSNEAGSEGGVISTIATTGLIIENCDFIENSATSGGAIRTNTNTITITIDECEFKGNSATATSGSGGALVMGAATTVTVTDTVFEGNKAEGKAGAVTVATGGKASFTNCEFKDNSGKSEGNDIRLGGATCVIEISGKFVGNVYNRNKSTVKIVGALSAGSAVELDWYKRTDVLFPYNAIVTFASAEVENASQSFIKLGALTTGYGCELVDSATADALDLVENN